MLARLDIEGFRSIRGLSLALRPLNVLVCPEGPGTSDLAAALSCLQELVDGRLQQHLQQQGGAATLRTHPGKRSTELRWGLEILPGDFTYDAALTLSDTGTLSLRHEELGVQQRSACLLLVDRERPGTEQPESALPTIAPVEPTWETFPESPDPEGRWLGFVFTRCAWELRNLLRGLQVVVPGQGVPSSTASILVLETPEPDLPLNEVWHLASFAREAAKSSQVFLCTRCVALANAFAHEDVIVVDTHENASRFQRLPPDALGTWLARAGQPA